MGIKLSDLAFFVGPISNEIQRCLRNMMLQQAVAELPVWLFFQLELEVEYWQNISPVQILEGYRSGRGPWLQPGTWSRSVHPKQSPRIRRFPSLRGPAPVWCRRLQFLDWRWKEWCCDQQHKTENPQNLHFQHESKIKIKFSVKFKHLWRCNIMTFQLSLNF